MPDMLTAIRKPDHDPFQPLKHGHLSLASLLNRHELLESFRG